MTGSYSGLYTTEEARKLEYDPSLIPKSYQHRPQTAGEYTPLATPGLHHDREEIYDANPHYNA